jgi:hypothetical protein
MKNSGTSKVQSDKRNCINDEAFADLKEALEHALAFERCERRDLKVTRIQGPRPPKTLPPQPVAHVDGRK